MSTEAFLSVLPENFRLADFFDIVIISALLYSLIGWFRRTASRSVVLGMTLVTAVFFLARTFDLYMTSLVFQSLFAVLLIALVVVFQEDIRRLFERIALWGTFKGKRRAVPVSPETDLLAEAIATLASQKVGALVVIQGKEPLDRHLDGGVPLRGQLSLPILYSIFDSSSPGHDGALLMKGNEIKKFGVHLPLSRNLKEVGDRGTRHTAALGLSEVSDALIIVVSEERGVISIAEGGKLIEIQPGAELKDQLDRFYQVKFPAAQKADWKDFFRQDARIKVASIFLACTFWTLFAHQAETVQRTFVIPIEYRNIPKGWLLVGDRPTEARVTLGGSERAFQLVNPATLIASLDLSKVQEGNQRFDIEEGSLKGSASLSMYRVEPNAVTLKAYPVSTVNLPVQVQTVGNLPGNLELSNLKAHPTEIAVNVWKTIEGQIGSLLTEPIDLSQVSYSNSVITKLIVPPHVWFLDGKEPEVRAVITVTQK